MFFQAASAPKPVFGLRHSPRPSSRLWRGYPLSISFPLDTLGISVLALFLGPLKWKFLAAPTQTQWENYVSITSQVIRSSGSKISDDKTREINSRMRTDRSADQITFQRRIFLLLRRRSLYGTSWLLWCSFFPTSINHASAKSPALQRTLLSVFSCLHSSLHQFLCSRFLAQFPFK